MSNQKPLGIVLNEDGYRTYPSDIFKVIEPVIRALNWRVSNVVCGGDVTNYRFPFEENGDNFVDGDTLCDLVMAHPQSQWWWGILSGFPKDVTWEDIKKKPVIELQDEAPYLSGAVKHIEPDAVLEIIAEDSSYTMVIADDERILSQLKQVFKQAESLDKYVY